MSRLSISVSLLAVVLAAACGNDDARMPLAGAGGAGGTVGGKGGSAAGAGAGGASAGAGGVSAGAGGSITGSGGAAGASGSLKDVAAPLDGQLLAIPCRQDTTAYSCASAAGTCPPANATDPVLGGAVIVDRTVVIGGSADTLYTISLHIQGVIEPRSYEGGADADGASPSPMANGLYTGGSPVATDVRNILMIRVTDPGAGPSRVYFLNSLTPPATADPLVYGVDYVARIAARGGAEVRLVAADPNCRMAKNCNRLDNADTCTTPIKIDAVEPAVVTRNPTFDFTHFYNGQWLVMAVLDVTSG